MRESHTKLLVGCDDHGELGVTSSDLSLFDACLEFLGCGVAQVEDVAVHTPGQVVRSR